MAPAGKPLTITADISSPAGIKWVTLRYRSVNQYEDYQALNMLPTDTPGRYSVTIPGDQIPSNYDFMYFFEVMDNAGHGRIYPDLNQTTPYFIGHLAR